ncbi:transcriptional regulator [Pasteurellaceae bacterium Pebbles2]|nr:transcriptional regulator [Pasteurellaceae bacterium Pebbles2]
MLDLTKINASEYEFSGEELGQLLLQSVKEMKSGQVGKVHIVNEAIEARQKTGLSQNEFAKVMGVSVRTLQGWEQGRRLPSGAAATLLKIVTRFPEALIAVRT